MIETKKRPYHQPRLTKIHHQAVEELAVHHYRHAAEKWAIRQRERMRAKQLDTEGT